jgi:thiol-disulfide isomerase/thioredoxin
MAILRMRLRRIVLPIIGALALVAAAYGMRVAVARSTGQSAPQGGDNLPVIRFVKDPEMAPPVPDHDISGSAFPRASWTGKVVLVNFWATWCPPCREEVPEMISLQRQFGDKLLIVGVSEDDDGPATVMRFAQHSRINYPIVMATPEVIAAYGGVPALPTTFVIDTQGRVMTKHAGLHPIDTYIREIRALLGQPVDARVETFADTGQVFLKNAANATELPGVNLTGLTPAQKKAALHRLNAESCTCGCQLTLSQCRVNDTECPVSGDVAAKVVQEVVHGAKLHTAPAPKASKSLQN